MKYATKREKLISVVTAFNKYFNVFRIYYCNPLPPSPKKFGVPSQVIEKII